MNKIRTTLTSSLEAIHLIFSYSCMHPLFKLSFPLSGGELVSISSSYSVGGGHPGHVPSPSRGHFISFIMKELELFPL